METACSFKLLYCATILIQFAHLFVNVPQPRNSEGTISVNKLPPITTNTTTQR